MSEFSLIKTLSGAYSEASHSDGYQNEDGPNVNLNHLHMNHANVAASQHGEGPKDSDTEVSDEQIIRPTTSSTKVDLISQRLPLKRKAPNDDDQPKSLSNHSDVEEERLLDNIEDDIEHVSALIKRAKRLHHTQSQSSKDGLNDETEQLTPPPDIESLLERAEAIIAKLKANILLELKRLTLEEEILGKQLDANSRLPPPYVISQVMYGRPIYHPD